jgi:quercetin dioxygenase-like cupin family protein
MTTRGTTPATRIFDTIAEGVALSMLRKHPEGGLTFLVRMQKGALAPRHEHPGGEETYLLEGRLRIQGRVDAARTPVPDLVLSPGDYVFIPPGETHDGVAEEDALLLVVAPGGVIPREPF